MHIRTLLPDEVELYWEFRLLALQESPTSFGSTYEEAIGTSLSTVAARMQTSDENYILGAFIEENIVGMVGFRREQGTKLRHKAAVWGMYVHPDYRQRGISKELMKELIIRSNHMPGLEQINLCVVTDNQSAIKLYTSVGFATYGSERRALCYKGIYYDEDIMVCFLEELS